MTTPAPAAEALDAPAWQWTEAGRVSVEVWRVSAKTAGRLFLRAAAPDGLRHESLRRGRHRARRRRRDADDDPHVIL